MLPKSPLSVRFYLLMASTSSPFFREGNAISKYAMHDELMSYALGRAERKEESVRPPTADKNEREKGKRGKLKIIRQRPWPPRSPSLQSTLSNKHQPCYEPLHPSPKWPRPTEACVASSKSASPSKNTLNSP